MNAGYIQNIRYDLFELILSFQPEQVVEFGAYDGATLTKLAQMHEHCHYVAVDNDADALSQIQSGSVSVIYDDLNEPDINKYIGCLGRDEKTVILLLDVLEHLTCPEAFMGFIKKNFSSGAILIISVPNVRNWRTFFQLLKGDWPQHEYGLFDRTHLHFFTKKSFLRRFLFCGKLMAFEYRYSKKVLFKFIQTICPSILCGQMTLVIQT